MLWEIQIFLGIERNTWLLACLLVTFSRLRESISGRVGAWVRGKKLHCFTRRMTFSPLLQFFLSPSSSWRDVKKLFICCFLKLKALLCKANKTKYNTIQWITWLGGRWRTQLTARRNVNCRTHEHRHFERTLRTVTCWLSMPGSGSVKHPSRSNSCIGLFLSSNREWL